MCIIPKKKILALHLLSSSHSDRYRFLLSFTKSHIITFSNIFSSVSKLRRIYFLSVLCIPARRFHFISSHVSDLIYYVFGVRCVHTVSAFVLKNPFQTNLVIIITFLMVFRLKYKHIPKYTRYFNKCVLTHTLTVILWILS